MTDTREDRTKWQFPEVILGPEAYLLIRATRNGRTDPLTATFGLSQNGEYVGLVRADGETIEDEIDFPPQVPDVSHGIGPDVVGRTRQFDTPTPGERNDTSRPD